MPAMNPPPTPPEQLDRIAAQLGVSLDDLRDGGRPYAEARALAAYALRKTFAGLTVQQIGALFGLDHSTICYYLKRVTARMKTDPAYAAQVRALIPGRYRLHTQRVVVVVAPTELELAEEGAL